MATSDPMNPPLDFRTIRSWDGSQYRAFEELAYQLREPAPPGATEVKTGDPDAGLEWYVEFPSGEVWGWQAKYSFSVRTLLSQMRVSVNAVVSKRPEVTRLTFRIPIDLPEDIRPGGRESARQRFQNAARRWQQEIPGASEVAFEVETARVAARASDGRG